MLLLWPCFAAQFGLMEVMLDEDNGGCQRNISFRDKGCCRGWWAVVGDEDGVIRALSLLKWTR